MMWIIGTLFALADPPSDPWQDTYAEGGSLGASVLARPTWQGIELGIDDPAPMIRKLRDGGAAEQAGLRAGDIVTHLDGRPLASPAQLLERLDALSAGEVVWLQIMRMHQAQPKIVKLQLEARPKPLRAIADQVKGHVPPELSVTDFTTGASVLLADLRGDVVLIEFWATWCAPCVASIPHLRTLHEAYSARGLTIVGISDEPVDKQRAFAEARRLPYRLLRDSEWSTAERYRVTGRPTAVLLDRQGRVAEVFFNTLRLDDATAAVERLLLNTSR
ncbi:MAG: redoxin domain-containing protein [Myxococcota bacterium]